ATRNNANWHARSAAKSAAACWRAAHRRPASASARSIPRPAGASAATAPSTRSETGSSRRRTSARRSSTPSRRAAGAIVIDRAPRQRRAMPRWLTLALQVAVSLALLAALIAIVDWSQLRAAAAALSLGAMIAVALCCLGAQVSLVLRWRTLLDLLGVRESWMRSWHSVFAGLFLMNFL